MKSFQPWGTQVRPVGAGECESTKTWVTSYEEATKMNAWNVSANVTVPYGVASVSASAAVNSKRMNNSKTGSEEIYFYNTCTITVEELEFNLFWDNDEGVKCRQRLNTKFRNAVAALPLPAFDPQVTYAKGQPMPQQLQDIRAAYETMITEYGTHFPLAMKAGGIRYEETKIKKSNWEYSTSDKLTWQAGVEVQVGEKGKQGSGGGGVSGGQDTEQSSTEGGSEGIEATKMYSRGGTGSTTSEGWNASVADAPAPISMEMDPLWKLLDPVFFPNDPKIAMKRSVLEKVLNQYLLDNSVGLTPPDGNFFSDKKSRQCGYTVTIESLSVKEPDDEGTDNEVQLYGDLDISLSNQYGEPIPWTRGPGNHWAPRKDAPIFFATTESVHRMGMTYEIKGGCADLNKYVVNCGAVFIDSDPSGSDDSLGKGNVSI
ncbi:MAG: hypothetical protein IPO90_04150 [Flavobacteriales bacterium]|nr:hypothetical protein [Flavobacteriales bacterium]